MRADTTKTDFVRTRIESHLKSQVHTLFDELGVTPSQAITMFYKSVLREQGLPFRVHMPNAETAKAIRAAKQKKGVVYCKDANDLFKKLGL